MNKIAHHWKKTDKTEKLRWLGSGALMSGYVLLVFGAPGVGLPIRLLGNIAMTPFAIKLKMWDVVCMQGFFGLITVGAMIPSLATNLPELPPPPPPYTSQNHYGI